MRAWFARFKGAVIVTVVALLMFGVVLGTWWVRSANSETPKATKAAAANNATPVATAAVSAQPSAVASAPASASQAPSAAPSAAASAPASASSSGTPRASASAAASAAPSSIPTVTPNPPTKTPTPKAIGGIAATPISAQGPQTAVAANGDECPGDKISTANEVEGAGPQRREIGGGGIQLLDHYPDRGILPITFLVPEQKPWIWFGFGSLWEYHGTCVSADILKQAIAYSKGRGDYHTGVTIDLTSGMVKLAGNEKKLGDDVINQWLAIYGLQLGGTTGSAKSFSAAPAKPTNLPAALLAPASSSTPGSSAGSGCKDVGADHQPGGANDIWVIPATTDWRIVLWWSKNTDPNVKNMKTLLPPGQGLSIIGGGGTLITFNGDTASCEAAAKARMTAETAFNEPTADQKKTYFR